MSPSYPLPNPASTPVAGRQQRALGAFIRLARIFDRARAGSSLLLAAVVAAMLVAVNPLVESLTDGNLLSDWMALWLLAFAGLALLAAPSRRAAAVREPR